MKKQRLLLIVAGLIVLSLTSHSQSVFQVVPLGVRGGSDESNLSAYALAVKGSDAYVCLDAGTVRSGITKAIANNVWTGDPGNFLKENIKGYLISHPHLDHVAGLIINSPDDSPKPIYGTQVCLDILKEKYFSWKNWANFGNEGEKPTLNKYSYVALEPLKEVPLQGTSMFVTSFVLSHVNPYESTAFLIRSGQNYILYLGDTGADEIEKSDKLKVLWETVAPMISSGKLKGIFIEVSYTNTQPVNLLFGHLTPQLLMTEMKILNKLTGNKLKNFPVVITHMKPLADREQVIARQLQETNTIGVKFIFPEQGKPLEF